MYYLSAPHLHILYYGKVYIFLVFLAVFFVLWVRQQLFSMLHKRGRLIPWRKYGILLLNQVFCCLYIVYGIVIWIYLQFTFHFFFVIFIHIDFNFGVICLIIAWSVTEPHLHFCRSFSLLCNYCDCSYFGAHILLYPSVWTDTCNVLCWCLFPSWLSIGIYLPLH